jgi:hypothetical protein
MIDAFGNIIIMYNTRHKGRVSDDLRALAKNPSEFRGGKTVALDY